MTRDDLQWLLVLAIMLLGPALVDVLCGGAR